MKTSKLFSKLLFVALATGAFHSFGQVKIGTNPTTIDPAANLEVEATTAGRKVSVDKNTGVLTLKDGTQAAGSILTSDANGQASWQPKSNIRVEETVFIGEQSSGKYLINTFNGTFNALKDRIPLVPREGSLSGYNSTTKTYTIQEDGYYRIFVGASGQGTLPNLGTNFNLYIGPIQALVRYDNITSGAGPVLSNYWQQYLTAGADITVYVTSQGANQNIQVTRAYLSISKLF